MSSRYLGGLVTKTPPTLNPALGNAANGVFTMDQYTQAVQAGTWPASDPYFENTTLLLHGNGTNGAQNNTFVDSSTNNFTITRNGNTTQGTFSPFSKPDGRWGNYFDGTGDNLTVANNAAFQLGSGDFTIEFWAYFNSVAVGHTPLSMWATNQYQFSFYTSATGVLSYYLSSNGTTWGVANGVSCGSVSANQWTHVALVRNGSTFTPYINGVAGTTTTSASALHNSTAAVSVGSGSSVDYFNGYISNVRIVKGTAVYTAGFTPSTAPLTAITNTSLLTCQSNRFIDNSSNNFAITRNGDVKVTPFSPFPITTAYSTSVNGGAGYFDGSGDYLSVADNAAFTMGSGDFTVEYWAFLTGTGNQTQIMQINSAGATSSLSFGVQINSSKWRCVLASGSTFYSATSSANAIANQWNHIAFVRNGNTGTLYVNGVADGTVSLTGVSINDSGEAVTIGAEANGNVPTTGYISSLRVVKGSAVYTTGFTPPTAPLTAITNTSLLTNFTNAGIFDNTGFNALETVGNAQIDTTTKKYGTGSMEFDGTTDYVVQPTSDNYGYGTGDFTIEFWLYLNSTGTQTIVSNLSGTGSTNPHIYINTTIRYYTVGADRITGASLSTGQWYHIAVCRASGSTRLFIDGTQSGSTYSDTNNYGATAPLGIGTYWNAGAPFTSSTLNGYIDDLRITKGIARYTSNFTPPTSQVQDV